MKFRRAALAGLVLAATTATAAQAAPELSTSDRLADRRYVAASERAQIEGFQDGRFYANGWHITGEMGGIWSPPLKLLDGVWFGIDDQWVGPAQEFTSGYGYTRFKLPDTAGIKVERTDFAPDGPRAGLFRLKLTNPGAARTVTFKVDAHSELLPSYPWGFDGVKPNASDQLPDTGSFDGNALVFRDQGTLPHENATPHDYAALVGSNLTPSGGETGAGHFGPQPGTKCPGTSQAMPKECDDGPFGKGTGGQLRYSVELPASGSKTVWVAVAGSDKGLAPARAELQKALDDPAGKLAAKVASREKLDAYSKLSLPGDQRLAQGIDWGKQNMADITQVAEDLQIRYVDQGKTYPKPQGTLAKARWVGAGFPDYPWIFATDAEYTSFASVTTGQFEAIEDHMRALRDISDIVNDRSGKVTHEITGDGANWFGQNKDPGNTDETVKFPSTVALIWRWTGDARFRDEMYDFSKRNLRYVERTLDQDGDGWPEGLGNVERAGMGPEKLDNTVYWIRGLYDLADMAQAKGDGATERWARSKADGLRERFEGAWWMPEVGLHADSLSETNGKIQQKHWITATPMEAELTIDRRAVPGLATFDHGTESLALHETPCFSGERPLNRGLFHTGCGGGPTGAGERTIFSLNTSIQGVGEGNYGRLGAEQQKRYTDANVETQFGEPAANGEPDEQPGAMPEILPSPDFGKNIDRCWTCRAMFMQAWGNYGTAWPVVHQQLGVRPDMGRGALDVVPQLPSASPIAGSNIRLGTGALKGVQASKDGARYTTTVDTGSAPVRSLDAGATLPRTAKVESVTLDGKKVGWQQRTTNRGLEITTKTGSGRHTVVVTAR
ncbi:MAG TPA: hypothetical protein VFN44_12310 [Solirubrobacteraceae bacterium]|nr:hypothetical protein [Solirubrobacteraceae bacterium]